MTRFGQLDDMTRGGGGGQKKLPVLGKLCRLPERGCSSGCSGSWCSAAGAGCRSENRRRGGGCSVVIIASSGPATTPAARSRYGAREPALPGEADRRLKVGFTRGGGGGSEQKQTRRDTFLVSVKPEKGASVSPAELGIRSYFVKELGGKRGGGGGGGRGGGGGEEKSAPGSFTVTPFLKSLVAVRPIEDN